MRQHRSAPVPLDPVPEPLRPLIEAGMAKYAADRPPDALTLAAALTAAAAGAYGPDWEERGRSKLGEAAVALAALWPSATPPAAQGFTIHKIRLGRVQSPRSAPCSSSPSPPSPRPAAPPWPPPAPTPPHPPPPTHRPRSTRSASARP